MPRKKPYSGKQKKAQLQAKRDKKPTGRVTLVEGRLPRYSSLDIQSSSSSGEAGGGSDPTDAWNTETQTSTTSARLRTQTVASGYDPNRFNLKFVKETKTELSKRKESAQLPLEVLPETALELAFSDVYPEWAQLNFPIRPPWSYNQSKAQLEAKETRYMREFEDSMRRQPAYDRLSYYETNLETWRQLWRVLEMSDVVLFIVDVRHPVIHFNPHFYHHVVDDLGKPLILVLNKVDIVSPGLLTAWKSYIRSVCPKLTHVIPFSSFPDRWDVDPTEETDGKLAKVKKRSKLRRFTPVGPLELYKACKEIAGQVVDLDSWLRRFTSDSLPSGEAECSGYQNEMQKCTSSGTLDGVLTIGCVGAPNVGKSSLINGLVGRKVVSTSKTPGHTKHFQTYYLTPTVRLCDCPGLVFPSVADRQLQVLAGVYPVAQVQEPYTCVGYLAQRAGLVRGLRLPCPADASAWNICEAWACRKRFYTARGGGRVDVFRAANHILRLAVEGRIRLALRPPGYTASADEWALHPDTLALEGRLSACRGIQMDEEPTGQADSTEEYESSTSEGSSNKESDGDESRRFHSLGRRYSVRTRAQHNSEREGSLHNNLYNALDDNQ